MFFYAFHRGDIPSVIISVCLRICLDLFLPPYPLWKKLNNQNVACDMNYSPYLCIANDIITVKT